MKSSGPTPPSVNSVYPTGEYPAKIAANGAGDFAWSSTDGRISWNSTSIVENPDQYRPTWFYEVGEDIWRLRVDADSHVYYATGASGMSKTHIIESISTGAVISRIGKLDGTHAGGGMPVDNLIWENSTFSEGTFAANSMRVENGLVIIAGQELVDGLRIGKVLVLNAETGELIWSKSPQATVDGTVMNAAIAGDCIVASCFSRLVAKL